MSRLGKKPVAIPDGVTVEIKDNLVSVKGPKGELSYAHLLEVTVVIEGDQAAPRTDGTSGARVVVTRKDDSDDAKARHGLTRQLIANMIIGVSSGYEKQLEIIGVGYKAQIGGKKLTLHLGYSHAIEHQVPDGIEVTQDEKNKNVLIIRGIDKQLVGQVAAEIRSYRPPEPYKGKGVRYIDEEVRRKPGKAAAKVGE